MITMKDLKRLRALTKKWRAQVDKRESAWQRATKWLTCFNFLGAFPFTFWVWKSGWHARRAMVYELLLKRLRGRLGFDLE